MSGRAILSATGLVTAVAGVTAAATLLPAGGGTAVPPRSVSAPVAATVLGCPGPPVLAGGEGDTAVGAVGTGADDAATDSQFSSEPAKTWSRSWVLAPAGEAAAGSVAALPADGQPRPEPQPLVAAGEFLTGGSQDGAPLAVTAGPGASGPATLGALSVAATPEGDLRGLTASLCASASTDVWLVGGATDVGRSARLVLENPGATTASVDLDLHTTTGVESPAAGRDVVVPPGERREVLLEGLVSGQPALAVHARVQGGRVAAFLLDSSLRGLVPGGVDVVAPASAPSTRQVVPGLVVDRGTGASLRLVAPGRRDAVVTYRLLGEGGQVANTEAVTTVAAGAVVDVALEGLAAGTYTAVVESETPVVAGAWMLRGTAAPDAAAGLAAIDLGDPTDVAWSSSVQPLTGPTVVPLPEADDALDGVVAALVLGAVDVDDGRAATVAVQTIGADGGLSASRDVVVASGSSVQLAGDGLAAGKARGVLLTPSGGAVAAGLVLRSDGWLATAAVAPPAAPSPDVLVSSRPGAGWP